MNIIDVAKVITIIPELVRDTLGFAQWNAGILLERLGPDVDEFDEDDEPELDDEQLAAVQPLPLHTSGRLALELIMITRATRNDHNRFQEMVEAVLPELDSPQHAMDIVMTLTSMVNALADDDDLTRFGESILHAEATS